MAYSEDDIIRLVTQYSGQAASAEQERDLRKITEAQLALDQAFRAGNVTQADYDRQTQAHASVARDHARELLRIEESMNRAGVGTRNLGQGLLTLGRGIQDFQAAGIMGVTNNIEQLVMALGGTAGLAGVVTVAAVGFQLAQPYIKDFLDSLKTGDVEAFTGAVKGLEQEIKALVEKPHKLIIDLQRLEEARKQLDLLTADLAAYDAGVKARTPVQEQQAKQVGEAITEFGGGTDEASGTANIAGVIEQIQRQLGTFKAGIPGTEGALQVYKALEAQDALSKRLDALNEALSGPLEDSVREAVKIDRDEAIRQIAEHEKVINEASRARIAAFVGAVRRGQEEERAELERLFMQNVPTFERAGVGAQFGAELIGASRENLTAMQEEARFIAEQTKAAKAQAAAEKAARAKLTESLNELGGTYEAIDREAIDALRKAQDPENQARAAKGEDAEARRDQIERARLRLRQREDEERQAEAEGKELERALGGKAGQGDVEEAGNRLLGVAGIRNPNQRARAAAQLDEEFKRHAFRRIVEAEPGVDPERAEAMASEAPAFYREAAEKLLQVQATSVQQQADLAGVTGQGFAAVWANQQRLNSEMKEIRRQTDLLHRVRAAMTPQGENFRDF